jgi:hypothetical protein
VDSQVTDIIKPTFPNPLEKSVTKENDDISSVFDPKGRGIDDGSATARGATTTGDGNDGDDNVYVLDYSNIRVQKFDYQGDFISKWGTKGKADSQFGVPHGLDIDKNDNIYVVDAGTSRIQKFDSNGEFLTAWGSKGSNNDQFLDPHSIAVS